MAFYGVEQVLDDVAAFIVASLGTHLTAVLSAAASGSGVTLAPQPAAPVAGDIHIASAGIDMGRPLGDRVLIVLRADTYHEVDRPNEISEVGFTLGLRVSEPSGKTVNTTRRLGRYIEALARLFDGDATCSTSYIIQILFPSPTVYGPETQENARTPVYQEAFMPLLAEIQESAA